MLQLGERFVGPLIILCRFQQGQNMQGIKGGQKMQARAPLPIHRSFCRQPYHQHRSIRSFHGEVDIVARGALVCQLRIIPDKRKKAALFIHYAAQMRVDILKHQCLDEKLQQIVNVEARWRLRSKAGCFIHLDTIKASMLRLHDPIHPSKFTRRISMAG